MVGRREVVDASSYVDCIGPLSWGVLRVGLPELVTVQPRHIVHGASNSGPNEAIGEGTSSPNLLFV